MKNVEKAVETGGNGQLAKLLGVFDENLNVLSEETGTSAFVEGTKVKFRGEEKAVDLAVSVFQKLVAMVDSGETPSKSTVIYCVGLAKDGNADDIEKLKGAVVVTARGKRVKCRTVGQQNYLNAIKSNFITFGIGPAGTGKTYLAVAAAVAAFKSKEVEKVILTRPAVEAGEKLGFLPGDLQNKVDPYLRPLYDALQEILGLDSYQKLLERGAIEIAPLAYMRGRTLSSAFIILDEAQNTTKEQMKMFLTRIGENSKMVVTGDLTQIDLPEGKTSGLKHAATVLKDVEGISAVYLTGKDVVRHPIVTEIVKAYERDDERREKFRTSQEKAAYKPINE